MLPEITHHNQNAYVQGRLILDASLFKTIKQFVSDSNMSMSINIAKTCIKAFFGLHKISPI